MHNYIWWSCGTREIDREIVSGQSSLVNKYEIYMDRVSILQLSRFSRNKTVEKMLKINLENI